MQKNLVNLVYVFFWLVGFGTFSALIYKIFTTSENSLFLSAFAILISAFLASLSMIKSINNSKMIEENKTNSDKETNILHLEYVLLDLLLKTKNFQKQFPHFVKRVIQLQNKVNNIQSEKKIADLHVSLEETIKSSNNFFIGTMVERKKQFHEKKIQLENPNLYKYLEEGNRVLLVHLCMKISELEVLIDLIEQSKVVSTVESMKPMIEDLCSSIISLIELQKGDIEKNHPTRSLFTMDEYEKYINRFQSEEEKLSE